MRIKSKPSRLLALSTLGVALSLLASGFAAAQDQPPQQFGPRAGKVGQQGAAPKVDVVATHGQWKVQCETPPAAAEGQAPAPRSCGMVQATVSEKNPKAFLNVIILRTKREDQTLTEARIVAPLGVFLPMGVALEIDGQAIGRIGFVRCMGQICMATGEIKPETLTKMKKGNAANFIIYEAPGIGLPMKLSLDGFSAALGELDKD